MKKLQRVSFWLIAGCVLALVPRISSAATIPVDYTVDSKDLKKNAPAGTMVTIELHQTADCSAAIATQTVDIASIQIIEAIKPAKIAGGTKRPKFARLNFVFTGVNPLPGDLFVKVTAPSGITPVGGTCQAQEPYGPVLGPTGATGPTGPTGPL